MAAVRLILDRTCSLPRPPVATRGASRQPVDDPVRPAALRSGGLNRRLGRAARAGRLNLAGLLLACVLAGAMVASRPAAAAVCEGGWVEVESRDPDTRHPVCEAAQAALAFLDSVSLRPTRMIRVRVVDQPLTQLGHPIYGRYDADRDLVEVMSMAAIAAQPEAPRMYDQPFDSAHYRAAVAHELAHAVVQHNGRVRPVSHTAQEYLAHATQLAVLPAALREAVIGAAAVGPWQVDDVISDVYMAMSLNRFAVKSYLHLMSQPRPAEFVAVLLSSRWRYVYVQ